MRHPSRHRLSVAVALLLMLGAALTPEAALGQTATPIPEKATYYAVKSGDTWTRVSRITGISEEALKASNPKAASHPRGWLIVGEKLLIPDTSAPPTASPAVPSAPGDQKGVWYQVRRGDTWEGLSSATGVNIARLWAANAARLDAQHNLYADRWILIPTGDASPPDAPTTATPTVTASPTTDGATPVAPAAGLDQVADAAATVSAGAQAVSTASAAAASAATVVAAANTIATAAAAAQSAATSIAVLNLNFLPAPAAPTATLTPVPASVTPTPTPTQSPTAAVTPTPAPKVSTQTATATRAVSAATPTSTRLASTSAGASNCLSAKVIAADALFARWNQDGFQPAIAAYQAVLADTTSTACGTVSGELDLLRDYARYRLLLASIAGGQGRQVQTLAGQIKNGALKSTTDAFQASLKSTGSIVQACRDANTHAKSKPEVWRLLAELGIRLKPAEICPL